MRFGVHIPVFGRYRLLDVVLMQLRRCRDDLYDDGITVEVALAVSPKDDVEYEQFVPPHEWGFYVVEAFNDPLADKCNKAVQKLGSMGVEACVGIGSDDLIHPNLFREWGDRIEYGNDQLAVVDGHFYDVAQDKLVYWGGYPEEHRLMEPLGMGRCLTRKALQAMDWQPFTPGWNNRLDTSITQRWLRTCWDLTRYTCKMSDIRAPLTDCKLEGKTMNPMPKGEDMGSEVLRTWYGGDVYEGLRRLGCNDGT